jgi:hypothetical protein
MRHYNRNDSRPLKIKPIPGKRGIFLVLVPYPKNGAIKDWAVILTIGNPETGRGTALARLDSWHYRPHVDFDYETGREKRWIGQVYDSTHLFEQFNKAEIYLKNHWRLFLENFLDQDPGFQCPQME